MNALATIRSAPGLEAYLERLEARLERAVVRARPRRRDRCRDALGGRQAAAAGARLPRHAGRRPWRRARRRGRGGRRARPHGDARPRRHARRRRAAPRPAHGLGRYGVPAAKAVGDYLFARAFAELAATGDAGAVAGSRTRSRARTRRGPPAPPGVPAGHDRRGLPRALRAQDRQALRGGVRPRRREPQLGAFGLALGIAFQIADDILDCTGEFDTTGKAPGVDLRDGTPTLPLILAAREDAVVWRALAGDPSRTRSSGSRRRGPRDGTRRRARVRRARPRRARRGARSRRARGADLRRRGQGRMIAPSGERWTRSARRSRRASGSTSRTASP